MTDWPSYLAGFHAEHPGITEQVLGRSLRDGMTPYVWLARAISGPRTLDLACGNGALGDVLAQAPPRAGTPQWVAGVDSSIDELEQARRVGRRQPLVCADAVRLPFADAAFDAVACSAGLMVLTDVDAGLAEVARVLRHGGVFAATVASAVPLRAQDMRRLAPLTARLRSTPQFPAGGELSGLTTALERVGLTVLEDARERFGFTVHTEADARVLVRSLYLPGTPDRRRDSAASWLAERAVAAEPEGFEIAVPVRRVVALRS